MNMYIKSILILFLTFVGYHVLADVPFRNVAEFRLGEETIYVEFEELLYTFKEDYCYYNYSDQYVGEAEQLIKERIARGFNNYTDSLKAYKELVIVPVNTKGSWSLTLHVTRNLRSITRDDLKAMNLVQFYKGSPYGDGYYDERMSAEAQKNLQEWNEIYYAEEPEGCCNLYLVGRDQGSSEEHKELVDRLFNVPNPRYNPKTRAEYEAIHDRLLELGLSALAFCAC